MHSQEGSPPCEVGEVAYTIISSIPFLGIVDADPYGLDILSVYKYGSKGMQHENVKLAATRIKWLGVWASELERYGLRMSSASLTVPFP